MNYPYLNQGNNLPAVGTLQKLLNNRAGASLVVDGIFGPKTKAAVIAFQKTRGLSPDGIVGVNTWPIISAETRNLKIVDCIDVFDESLMNLEAKDIRNVGGYPFLIGGMSNGVEQAISNICAAVSWGNVFLLRFHGHGAPGNAGVSDGHGAIPGEHLSSFDAGNINRLLPNIKRLKQIFGPYGCIQFMHCSTGRGPQGSYLLKEISNALGVPVTAAIRTQLGGGLNTFRFEGPTKTIIPGNGSIKNWCRNLPNFIEKSVNVDFKTYNRNFEF
jgi:peptidoglycan hydrolase-like protein with peptidoglycan-binding domain